MAPDLAAAVRAPGLEPWARAGGGAGGGRRLHRIV